MDVWSKKHNKMSNGKYHIHIHIVDFSIDKYLTLQREYIIITTVIYKNKNGNIYINYQNEHWKRR